MNLFRITPSFTKTASDYITKDAVKRANKRLISASTKDATGLVSIYDKHNISRPTSKQIASAASNAMRKLESVL